MTVIKLLWLDLMKILKIQGMFSISEIRPYCFLKCTQLGLTIYIDKPWGLQMQLLYGRLRIGVKYLKELIQLYEDAIKKCEDRIEELKGEIKNNSQIMNMSKQTILARIDILNDEIYDMRIIVGNLKQYKSYPKEVSNNG